ncbi:transglutaminase family protein [Conexibacter sp. DBS9H8]|uniref:transglutaminase family protein n=1 Tax=Conexibacter sp. DBS9H8 TaxID=2937801 RepID=UPI00200C26CC|nr:transglutaminase family protein [Conexibacter sp. DBS9H8]
MSPRYRVSHTTEYRYSAPVNPSYGLLHLLPRDLPGQRCERSEVSISPTPELTRERRDFFGNRVISFVLSAPHTRLRVAAESCVVVEDATAAPPLGADAPWETAAEPHELPLDVLQFRLASPLIPAPGMAGAQLALSYARECVTPGMSVIEAVCALTHRIHADFRYAPGATTVATPLSAVFAGRAGVCQDFAHVGIACLRALGIPARYVSGYLETDPPPGRPKLTGVDGSHAWFAAHVPGAGWVGADPTNDQTVNARYVTTAIGRDYSDVPPMQGVLYSAGTTEALSVAVDVSAFPPAPAGAPADPRSPGGR